MNDEASWFVHHEDVLVFEDYGDGNVFRRDSFFGEPRLDELAVPDLVRRRSFLAVYEQLTLHDEALHYAAAEPETTGGQPVETISDFRWFYPETLGRHTAIVDTRIASRALLRLWYG
jgi:hypothetical protein